MKVIRKSANENVMIVQRAAGFAVSIRAPKWVQAAPIYRAESVSGAMVHDWECVAKGLTLAEAESLFAEYAAPLAA
jgi:hypothetical protein